MALSRFITLSVLFLAGCATIAPYSQAAYEQATTLKAEALILVSRATEQYSQHRIEAERVRLDMHRAYEYAKGRPKNEISTRQWEIVRDPEGNSLGGFLSRWEEDGVLSETFVAEARHVISDQLDQVIGLESGKVKP